jgi:hypothetical protein
MLSIGLWRWYINITITILDIIHHPVFYLKLNSTLWVCLYIIGNTLCLRYGPNRFIQSIGLWRRYINITITILDIIHRPVLLFRTRDFGDWILSPAGGTYLSSVRLLHIFYLYLCKLFYIILAKLKHMTHFSLKKIFLHRLTWHRTIHRSWLQKFFKHCRQRGHINTYIKCNLTSTH